MAANLTSSTNPAQLLRTYFDRQLMDRLEKDLIAKDLVNAKVVPANSGNVIAFHRIQNMPLQTVGITQTFGSAHSSVSGLLKGLTYVVDEVTATLAQFGADMQLSEQLIMTSEPNPIPELTDIFLYNAAATLDQKLLWHMTGVSSAITGSGTPGTADYNDATLSVSVVWGDASATLTEATLDADNPTHLISAESFNTCFGRLRRESAPFHPRFPGRYAAIISPGQATNLRLDGTFQEIALKGTNRGENKFESAMVGDVFGCRVLESAHVAAAAGTVDATNDQIHRAIVFGNGYYYNVSHAQGIGRPKVNFLPPTVSPADPYGNIGILSWKLYWAGAVVNPLCGVILKTATTNVASSTGYDNASPNQ